MIKEAIRQAMDQRELPFELAKAVMQEIMNGEATDAQIAAFLTALRVKGETIGEITACASVMREHCIPLAHEKEVLEIVGTGGDEAFTFNISSVAAFVIAASGVPVAKHGNRSVSSRCGAADFFEALGIKLELTAEQSLRVLRKTGMCFMFAPQYHASMKYVASVRKELGARTIFNILGPLANPAGAALQLLGVYDKKLVRTLAQVLANLGVRRAMVVCGDDGLDEITLTATTTVCEVRDGMLSDYMLDPREYGLKLCSPCDLLGGDAQENAMIGRRILRGDKAPKRDIVLLNAAACLYLAGKAENIAEGIALATRMIDGGEAERKLLAFVRATNEVG